MYHIYFVYDSRETFETSKLLKYLPNDLLFYTRIDTLRKFNTTIPILFSLGEDSTVLLLSGELFMFVAVPSSVLSIVFVSANGCLVVSDDFA